jgi:hypothetical protein
MFDHPCGIYIAMMSQGNALTTHDSELIASIFLENCYVQNIGLTMAAQAVVLAEQVFVQFERMIPVDPALLETT